MAGFDTWRAGEGATAGRVARALGSGEGAGRAGAGAGWEGRAAAGFGVGAGAFGFELRTGGPGASGGTVIVIEDSG